MPRANRFMQPGLICHLTHRCHNRAFLLGFARDRSVYRERLRQASKKFRVSLLNYCLTSNHIHIIAIASWLGGIWRMMQKVEGDFAGYYNRRKRRSGSFWEDRYHCTMVEDGEHLKNCITYVDMNMVRAGVVAHPKDWSWCGYLELIAEKNRYRLLDIERLMELMGESDRDKLGQDHQARIQNAIEGNQLQRQSCWTESIAVGSKLYVEKIAATIKYKRRILEIDEGINGSWYIRESTPSYQAGKAY
jgi:putative transposase